MKMITVYAGVYVNEHMSGSGVSDTLCEYHQLREVQNVLKGDKEAVSEPHFV